MASSSRGKRDRDEEDDEPKKGAGAGRGKEEEPQFASLDDDDAIDVGLFSSGPAHVQESLFTEFDYGGTVTRNPPIVWLLTLTRGTGKDKEQYEQPYTLGKGWKIDPKTGKLKGAGGGLPKSCNAIVHLIKPLKRALAKAGIDAGVLAKGDPRTLEGMDVEVERVEQEVRNIRNRGNGRDREPEKEDRGPKTILEIRSVESAPWDKGNGSGKAKGRARDEEEEKPARGGRGKAKEEEQEDEPGDSVTDDAIEALVAVVEKGKVKIGDPLEEALEKYLKGVKNAGEIIDLATSPKFLKTEKGWAFDGRFVDAAE